MSYYVPSEARYCLKLLIDKYDFKNYDYGSEELNEYASTLDNNYFMKVSYYWHKGFSDFADLTICQKQDCNLKHYYFSKEDKSGFQLLINGQKYKYMEVDAEEYADYLYNYVLTPERLIPRIAKFMKERMEYEKELRIKKDKEEYPYYPDRWTPKERIEAYVDYVYDYKDDTRCYSDDYREYDAYSRFMDSFSRLEKAMSKSEIRKAATLYKKKYKRDLSSDRENKVVFNECLQEGFIDDFKTNFGRRLEKSIIKSNDIEYTPENSKSVYTTTDILMLMSKRFQNKFEQFIIEASKRGKDIDDSYKGRNVDYPPVAFERGKFYVKTIHDGWRLVNFNYDRVKF